MKRRFLKNLPGFTLLEFIVVIGLLMLAIGSALGLLTSILRGTNQSLINAEVKQNGQQIMDSLDKQIRNATDIVCKDSFDAQVPCNDPSVSTKYIKLIRPGLDPMHVKCFDSTSSTNGYIGTVVTTTESPSDSWFTPFTNTDSVTGVNIASCSLTALPKSEGNSSPPLVNVSFMVEQGVQAPSRQDFQAKAEFKTTISLRNYDF